MKSHLQRRPISIAALAFLAAWWVSVGLVREARADELDQFVSAKAAFDSGDFAEAVARFDGLLKNGLANPALAIECHKFSAIGYLFLQTRDKAEYHFTELLTLSPDYSLDPMIFPIEVVDFFLQVKEKNKERLAALKQIRQEEEKKRQIAAEARRKAELERLTRNIYLRQERKEHSLLVALLPFGAGQFQNGHKIKGALFLTGEALLGAAAVTTYILHEQLRPKSKEPFGSNSQRDEYMRREVTYRIVNQASLVGLTILTAIGLVDSLYCYRAEVIAWAPLDEQSVPKQLRPGASRKSFLLTPSLSADGFGLLVFGQF